MNDYMLNDSARTLSRAIGNRWGGWYDVTVGRDADGTGSIRVSFDRSHAPALTVGRHYQGYPIHLIPAAPPVTRKAARPPKPRANPKPPPGR